MNKEQLMLMAVTTRHELATKFPEWSKYILATSIRFSNKTTQAAGIASVYNHEVVLSWPIFKLLENQWDFEDTVRHEFAHLLTPGQRHNAKWRAMAVMCGAKPQRYHSLKTAPRRVQVRYEAVCLKCDTRLPMSGQRRAKMLKGQYKYTHHGCGGSIKLTGKKS